MVNPKQIIEITDAHEDEPNIEGVRQENCSMCMCMNEGDVSSVNKFLRNKYAPEINDQPIKEDLIKQED